MSRVKLSSASTEEIEAFAATLRTAGYLVVQVSPQELEIRPPVPEHIASTRRSAFAEQSPAIVQEISCQLRNENDLESDPDATQELEVEPSLELEPEEGKREFILAPLFRKIRRVIPHPRFKFPRFEYPQFELKSHLQAGSLAIRGALQQKTANSFRRLGMICGASAASILRRARNSWQRLNLTGRWRKSERGFAVWQANAVQRIRTVAEQAREPKQVRLVVVPPRNIFDRVGWAMTATVVLALVIVGSLAFHTDSVVPEQSTAQTVTAQTTQSVASNSAPAAATIVKAPATAQTRQKPRAARSDNAADDSDGQEVVVRHFTAQKKQPQIRQVAGIKHFSDMDR